MKKRSTTPRRPARWTTAKRNQYRAAKARLRRLEVLAVAHPELGEAVKLPSSALSDQFTMTIKLAEVWEVRARALGLLATDQVAP